MSFEGRTALITGAASGIGLATARWLDARGVSRIIAVDIDAEGLAAMELGCEVHTAAGDVSDPDLWDALQGDLGHLDHALINAGIADGCPLVDQSFHGWRKMLGVNLDGAFLALRASLRVMRENACGKSIVLTSSVAGIRPLPFTAAYGSSKAAIAHLARIAAAEHASDGIRVNAVAPGRVDTPIWTKTAQFQQLEKDLGSREAALAKLAEEASPLGRVATADELAGQIGFLLSDEAWNITGTVMVSDGGYSL
ncbi:MAG: SDR family oxidoreductase [Sphingomonadaceae bacterium]